MKWERTRILRRYLHPTYQMSSFLPRWNDMSMFSGKLMTAYDYLAHWSEIDFDCVCVCECVWALADIQCQHQLECVSLLKDFWISWLAEGVEGLLGTFIVHSRARWQERNNMSDNMSDFTTFLLSSPIFYGSTFDCFHVTDNTPQVGWRLCSSFALVVWLGYAVNYGYTNTQYLV